MYSGTSQSTGKYTTYTGLAAFKILAVNPTKDQIEELTGRPYPFDITYELRQDSDQQLVRPIDFWVSGEIGDTKIVDKVSFQIGNTLVKSQTGNSQFINAKGTSRYALDIDNANMKYEKVAPFVRAMYVGEDSLYSFMQRALGYKPSDPDAKFLADSEAAGITPASLYAGDVTGLRNFVEFVNSKNRKIGLVLGVRQKEKLLENGNKVMQNRQVILNNSDFFFTLATGHIEEYNLGKMQEAIEQKQKAGISLGTALFTIKFQEFEKEACVNNAPENPSAPTAVTWGS